MGISMSESEQIRRLQISDERYRNRLKERLGRSAPQQFRDLQNQQISPSPEKLKIKHLATEPKSVVNIIQSTDKEHRTLEYELQADLDEFDLKGKAIISGRQPNRRVKENLNIHDGLRVTKSNTETGAMPNPLSMRSRKVKVGKK